MTVPVTDLLRILPELVLAAFGTLIVLVEPFLRRTQKSLTGYIALIGTLLALLSTLAPAMNPGPAFNGLVLVDGPGFCRAFYYWPAYLHWGCHC